MSSSGPTNRSGSFPGLLVVLGIILLGLGTGAAYFHYKWPRLKEEHARKVAAAPRTPEGRLERWHHIGAPQFHHRLSVFGRFSEERPWLITHAVESGDGEVELWGLDCEALPVLLSHLEGMRVVVELPHPSPLGRLVLQDEHLGYIPVYPAGVEVPDPDARLETLVWHLLERLPQALEKDIPGASIELRIGATGSGGAG